MRASRTLAMGGIEGVDNLCDHPIPVLRANRDRSGRFLELPEHRAGRHHDSDRRRCRRRAGVPEHRAIRVFGQIRAGHPRVVVRARPELQQSAGLRVLQRLRDAEHPAIGGAFVLHGEAAPVPEPGTLVLLGSGLLYVRVARTRKFIGYLDLVLNSARSCKQSEWIRYARCGFCWLRTNGRRRV